MNHDVVGQGTFIVEHLLRTEEIGAEIIQRTAYQFVALERLQFDFLVECIAARYLQHLVDHRRDESRVV